MTKAAKHIACLMMAHYENPIESPYEWLASDGGIKDGEEIADWIDENIKDMYSEETREFRQAIYDALKEELKL